MAKYSLDLDEKYVNKVKMLSTQFGLRESGVRLEAIRMRKGKTYGEVKKAGEVGDLFTGQNLVVVALYEEVFDRLDEKIQDVLIENLLEQIYVQEKEDGTSIKIEKPQLNLGIQTYHKYGNIATQNLEAVLLVLDQMTEQEKAEKEARKEEKRQNKKNKNNY